ncbi:MAG: hypothetical protein GY732_17540 [Gammaproteobacteria bacterium]|nr:hypothetical protein [Gammaproteobacteria bacterium]
MKAPKAYGATKPYNEAPLPTFALRHNGDAWDNPFAVVYESYTNQPVIMSVERLMESGVLKGVKVTSNVEGHNYVQYVIMQESIDADYVNKESGIAFKGRFAVVTLDQDGNWTEAYIGNGRHLNYKDLTLNADEHSHAAYLEK